MKENVSRVCSEDKYIIKIRILNMYCGISRWVSVLARMQIQKFKQGQVCMYLSVTYRLEMIITDRSGMRDKVCHIAQPCIDIGSIGKDKTMKEN